MFPEQPGDQRGPGGERRSRTSGQRDERRLRSPGPGGLDFNSWEFKMLLEGSEE